MMLAASLGSDLFRAFLQGLPAGLVYALVALGFVVTFKTSGVFNLAFGAQAYVSAAMYFKARVVWEWGIVPSVILAVVVVAPLVGLLLERLIFRHLRTAPQVSRLVVGIGLAVALPSLFNLVANYKVLAGVTPEGVVNDGNSVFYDPFGSYPFSRNELVAMAVVAVATLGLFLLFRFSAIGLRMRAVVESARMTELNGIAADRVSAFAWALSSFFAGLAGVLIAPRFNTLAPGDFFSLMVVAVAAAAVGKLVSLPMAVVGGILLGQLIAQLNTFMPRWSDTQEWLRPIQASLTPAIPFLVLFGILVFVPAIRRARDAGDPLAGVDPPPTTLGAVDISARRALIGKLAGAAALAAILLVVLTRGDQQWLFLVTQAIVMGTIYLSITVIVGLAGQISLCQGAFAASGAFAAYQLSDNVPGLVAILIGALLAAAMAAVLSLPIRRLGGIWTAVATLAFAYFFDAVIAKLSWVSGGTDTIGNGTAVKRPSFGPFDLNSDKSFLVLCLVVLVILALAVTALRTSGFGKTLIALRGSEVAAQSIGISPARSRLIAFALSGFIAAIGGGLLAMLGRDVHYDLNFTPFAALFWVVIVVVLGARTVQGAINAGASFSLFSPVILQGTFLAWILRSPERIPDVFPISGEWMFILFGFAAIQFAHHPEGLIEHGAHQRAARAAKRAAKKQARIEAAAPPAAPAPTRTEEPVA